MIRVTVNGWWTSSFSRRDHVAEFVAAALLNGASEIRIEVKSDE